MPAVMCQCGHPKKADMSHRYIFSRDISNFTDKANTNRPLAMSCLAYLSSGVTDTKLDDEDIDKKIHNGHYRLLQYATICWPMFIPPIDRAGNSSELTPLLEGVIAHGRKLDFDDETDDADSPEDTEPHYQNAQLQADAPDVYDMLRATFRFRLDEKRWEWNWTNSRLLLVLGTL